MFLRTESDAELVARTRKGDVEAFNHLVSRWEKRLYNYLLRLLANRPGYRDDALDLAQEAFLKAYQNIGTLTDAEKFAAWLYRIAHNLTFSQLRTQLGQPAALELVEEGGQDRSPEWSNDWKEVSAGFHATPQPAFGREMEIAVARALDSLAAEQREAIVLKVYHGFRFEEIAEIISCPVSTVKTRVYAGFAQLRSILEAVPAPSQRIVRR
ncbi:MAG: sigma-70 family RNA polymerase sigma factor [Acidobacteria bacterium]|nr:sigma-70 family RNA polymerase sigma factor [Acidobacteriota bacterium]